MSTMETDRMAQLLDGPHQAVLSLSRGGRSPVAVPISYHFTDDGFYMVTSPASVHGRLMSQLGRATVTVQFEACDGRNVQQWYVMAEGPDPVHRPRPAAPHQEDLGQGPRRGQRR